MNPVPIKLAGLGSALPERRVSSAEIAAVVGVAQQRIEQATGVYERRYVTSETTASMGAAAARQALEQAQISIDEVDVIIGASTAPQQMLPCTAVFFQRALGAPEGRSVCFDVNATCLSFLVALQTAAHLIAAGVYRTALIISSEIASTTLNYQQWESAVLFGDAAAAAVVTATPPGEASALHYSRLATYSSGAEWTQIRGGGTLHHPSDPATTPEMNVFDMHGPAIFRFALRVLPPFVQQIFDELGWERRDIATVVPHQASRHGIELATSRLGFTSDQIFANLAVRGNCVAASIPLALCEAVQAGRIVRGDRVLLIGTGAGLTLGASVLTF